MRSQWVTYFLPLSPVSIFLSLSLSLPFLSPFLCLHSPHLPSLPPPSLLPPLCPSLPPLSPLSHSPFSPPLLFFPFPPSPIPNVLYSYICYSWILKYLVSPPPPRRRWRWRVRTTLEWTKTRLWGTSRHGSNTTPTSTNHWMKNTTRITHSSASTTRGRSSSSIGCKVNNDYSLIRIYNQGEKFLVNRVQGK